MIRSGRSTGFPGRDRLTARAFSTTGRNLMLIKMTANITGTRDGVDWPAVGGTLDVPDSEAADLIAAGLAEAEPVPAAGRPKKGN